MLDVALLGTGGMMPLPSRFLSSMICRLNGKYLLIDCGEGTQVTLKMLGWGFKNIDVICITHYHADHIAGLPGLLLTIGNTGRTEPIHMIGPYGLAEVVRSLCIVAPELPFDILFHEIHDDDQLFQLQKPRELKIGEFKIGVMMLEHRIPCFAYNLTVERKGKFDVERALKLDIPKMLWSLLQNNKDVEHNGQTYTSDMVLGKKRKGIKLTYCTDTRPPAGLPEFAKHSDLFICEGMYGEDEKLEKAIDHRHMIYSEAAMIAKKADVRELWLTHFSPSMPEPHLFASFAQTIFPNTVIGYDRMNKTFLFEE